jgi:hypothetical protein
MGDNEKLAEEICIQKQMFVTMEHQVGGHATTKTSKSTYYF